MTRNHRRFRLAILVFAPLLVVGTVRADVIEQILVRVNGEVYTKSDLEARQVSELQQLGRTIDPKTDFGDVQLKKLLDQVTPQIMVNVVDEMLLLQRGRELGYKLSDDQFKSVVDSLKKDHDLDTDEKFEAALKQENLTLVELRKNIERTVIMDRVRQNEVLGKIGVSEDEARRYYDAHTSEFTKPQQITLREVQVAVPNTASTVNVAQENAAREKIEDLRSRALAGDSFEKLAADFSDAPSRANAGLIGPINVNDISADLRKLLEQMKVGDITEPLRTPTGFQILKLESRSDTETMPFEQARDQISDKVFTEKRQGEYEKYLAKLRADAFIDWKNPEIKKAYDLGLEQIKAGISPLPPR